MAGELKDAGFAARELESTDFQPRELRAAGFTAGELDDEGFRRISYKTGFTATEVTMRASRPVP